MKLYQLHVKQALPISQKMAWVFLSNPNNLIIITSKHMAFTMLSGGDRPIYPAQIISYNISPFPLCSTKWVTEITHVKESEYFIDERRFGPYVLWHHKHFLKPIEGGVEMDRADN